MQKWQRENFYKVVLVIFPALLVIVAGIIGVWALLDVPVMGVRLAFSSGGVRVSAVDEQGPAAGLIFSGEYLRSIGAVTLEQDDLLRYPEFVLNADEQAWWERQRAIYEELKSHNPVAVVVASADQVERMVWLRSEQWTLAAVLGRGFPIYLSGLILAGMSILIYSLSQSMLHRTSQIFFVSLGLYHMVTAPMALREITLNPSLERILTYAAFIAAGGCITLIHFSLIFPRRKKILITHPRLMWIPYIYYGATVFLYLTGITAFGSTYLCLNLWSLVVIVATVHGYFSEEDWLLKQQILLFLMIPVLLALFFCIYIILPGVMRTNMFEYSYFAILSIASVFSMALAVENRRIYLESLEKEQGSLRDRLQMVREMHDNFGNVLTGIVRLAGYNEIDGQAPAGGDRALPQIKKAAQNCVTEMRNFIAAVDPVSSLWRDYAAQCQRQAADYLEPQRIQLVFRAAIDAECETIRPPVQYHLNGIVREALGNIVKHAGAREVAMSLEVHANNAELRIEDDGVGFDRHSSSSGSHGLINMEERAKELGGSLKITSSSTGTHLAVTFTP